MAIERWRPRLGLIPWSPYRELEDMERHMDTMFGEPLSSLWSRRPEITGWLQALMLFEKIRKL